MNAQAAQLLGQQLGNWRLLSLVGEGTFGAVYEAENVGIAGRHAAVKVLHPHLSVHVSIKQRFLNEASAASRAEHENIVQIFDGGIAPNGLCYSVMELLRGETLAGLLRRERIPVRRALHVGVQVAAALQAAHAVGVVHRDLKPDNIFLVPRATNPDFVKVLDFGVAKLRDDQSPGRKGSGLTQSGMLVGTPGYMAPEQWKSLPDIDGRADLYSLGIILIEAVTGALPFEGSTPYEWLKAHVEQPVPDLTLYENVGPELGGLLARMIAKERDDRPASMDEVIDALLALDPSAGASELRAPRVGDTIETPAPTALAGLAITEPEQPVPEVAREVAERSPVATPLPRPQAPPQRAHAATPVPHATPLPPRLSAPLLPATRSPSLPRAAPVVTPSGGTSLPSPARAPAPRPPAADLGLPSFPHGTSVDRPPSLRPRRSSATPLLGGALLALGVVAGLGYAVIHYSPAGHPSPAPTVAPNPAPAPAPPAPVAAVALPSEVALPLPPVDVAGLLDQAERDLHAHRYREAEAGARKASIAASADPRVWRAIGEASCGLKDPQGALEAASHLAGRDKRAVQRACGRGGLKLWPHLPHGEHDDGEGDGDDAKVEGLLDSLKQRRAAPAGAPLDPAAPSQQ